MKELSAHEENMRAAHKALVTAKYMLNAAAQQTDDAELARIVGEVCDDTMASIDTIHTLRFAVTA